MGFENNPNATATITVTTPVVAVPAYDVTEYRYGFEDYSETTYPAQTVFTDDFATSAGAWLGGTLNTFYGHTAAGSVVGSQSSATPVEFRRFVNGLVVGRTYTFPAWVATSRSASTTVWAALGVVGIGDADYATISPAVSSAPQWVQLTFTFTATATSHTLRVRSYSTVITNNAHLILDDVSLIRDTYTTVTNNGLGGWTSEIEILVTPGFGIDGTPGLVLITGSSVSIARAFTGLVVGHQYTLRGKQQTTEGGPWETRSVTVTAAATSQSFSLLSDQPEGVSVWDDMELIHHVPAVMTLTPVLPLSDGDATLDSARYPYVQSTAEVALTGIDLQAQITRGQRVVVNATDGESSVSMDLSLRRREISHDGKVIRLDLASDEAILDTWANIVDDGTPRTYEANLRSLINYVLNKAIPGASLQVGSANANLTAAWPVTNLFPDPSAESATPVWTPGTGAPGVVRVTSPVWSGSYSVRVQATAAQAYANGPTFSASAGRMYTASFQIRSTVARNARVMLRFLGPGGNSLRDNYSTNTVTSTSAWQRRSITAVAPPGTSQMQMYIITDGNASGNAHYVDGIMLNEGVLEDWHSGGTANTSLYTYEWTSTANESASERIPVVERLPELFVWKGGVTAWEFLSPLVAAAGLRLFCDEQRRWWLINPATYVVPGRFSARQDNAVSGTDTIDADDEDSGITGVVVVYTWRDANGITKEKREAAGTSGRVKVLEFDREYPGPGLAAAHLSKLLGQDRLQDVATRIDYTIRPGMEVQIDLPGTNAQLGTLSRVKWEITTGLQSIGSAQLRDTPAGSIDLLVGTIDQLTGTIDHL